MGKKGKVWEKEVMPLFAVCKVKGWPAAKVG